MLIASESREFDSVPRTLKLLITQAACDKHVNSKKVKPSENWANQLRLLFRRTSLEACVQFSVVLAMLFGLPLYHVDRLSVSKLEAIQII